MLKIAVLTKLHPIEVIDVVTKLYNALGQLDQAVFIGSPFIVADMTAKTHEAAFIDTFYPALRAYRNVDQYAEESGVKTIVTVGTVDMADLYSYDAIIGLNNPDIEDYNKFNEETNTTNIKYASLKNSDLKFDNIDEVIIFIRKVIQIKEKEEYELQHTTGASN